MAKSFPIHPAHPERNCWGCDKFCASGSLLCGNGSERTQHPVELFGDDWFEWGLAAGGAGKDRKAGADAVGVRRGSRVC
jgi:hypothetical protein